MSASNSVVILAVLEQAVACMASQNESVGGKRHELRWRAVSNFGALRWRRRARDETENYFATAKMSASGNRKYVKYLLVLRIFSSLLISKAMARCRKPAGRTVSSQPERR